MATYTLKGKVINKETRKGIAGLRVQGWDSDVKLNDLLGESITDDQGRFTIKCDDSVFSDQGQDRIPDVFVKIFSAEKLIHTSQPVKNRTPEGKILEIELTPPATAEEFVRLSFLLSTANNKLAAGVQLILSYDLASGEAWTSQPQISDNKGELAFNMPKAVQKNIDWSRLNYQFSRDDKPLLIVDKSSAQPTDDGYFISVTLGKQDLPRPPEIDPDKWYVRGRLTSPYGDAEIATVSAAAISLNGEHPLGQVQTSDSGRYEIVYDWDGRCPPDIQVEAWAGDERIAQSAIYFAVGKSIRVDLVTGNDSLLGPTEFRRVEERILKCNDEFNIIDIGAKQIEYLLGKTRLPRDKLNYYLAARTLASRCDVPSAVFYGLFRSGLPASLQGLVLQDNKVVRDALGSAIKRNIIDRKYQDYQGPLQAALQQMAVEGSLNSNRQLDQASVGDLLTLTKVPKNAHENLVNLYFEHEGDDVSYWEALNNDAQFGKHAGKVKLGLQAGALALYHPPSIEKLTAALGSAADVKQLAFWQASDWQAFEQSLESVPDNIEGDSDAERRSNYVDGIRRTVKRAFAQQYTTANVLRSDTFTSPPLREFLTKNPDFDYRNSSIPAVLDKAKIPGEQRSELENTLKGMQRLYRVAPLEQKFEVVESLYADNLTSARDITRLGEAPFVNAYTGSLGGAANAQFVFRNAATVAAVSANIAASYGEMFHAADIYAIGGGISLPPPSNQGDLVIPSYQDLFGSQGFCECRHCSSVYSPAAYFVDLLEYLRTSPVTDQLGGSSYVQIEKDGLWVDKTGLDVLFERRADLGDVRLDCKNTNTVMPYIDLVNESFERAVVGETDNSSYQTNWSEAELRANPEHIISEAYDVLAQTPYPLTLPFRLWNSAAENYLDHLGVARWALMETILNVPTASSDAFDQICFAYLGLTEMDVDILKGSGAYSGSLAAVGSMWGYDASGWQIKLARVPEFLTRSGLSYDELLQLLQVEFINVDGDLGIDFSEAETACDIEGAVLRYRDSDGVFLKKPLTKQTCDHIQRFLRLRLKTGWSIWELGRVLSGLNASRLNLQVLKQVSVLKRIVDTLKLDVVEAMSLWSSLDTALDEADDDYRSFYESVFLNPAVLNPAEEIFLLHEDRSQLQAESEGRGLISEYLPAISAALQISETEALLLVETLQDGSGLVDDALTLANLSQLYRIALLCRIKDITVNDYLLLVRLVAADWTDAAKPKALLQMLDAIDVIKSSGFSVTELAYLLLHDEASVASEQLDSITITGVLADTQSAVQAVWAQYALSSSPIIEQLQTRLGEYFAQSDIDLIVNLTGQQETRSSDDEPYLLDSLIFLPQPALSNAVDQGQTADLRYASLLRLLNVYGRNTNSTAVVAQIISETFILDLSAAELILTDIVPRSDSTDEFAIHALVDPLFIESGKEKLAAALDAEYWADAFAIIEGHSSMADADIEDFIEQQFTFLESEEAKTNLTGADALADTLARYQYVTAALDDSQYEFTEDVFAEQFSIMRRLQKTAVIVSRFAISHTELPALHDYAGVLKILPLAGFPFEEIEQGFIKFHAWLNLLDALQLRDLFANADTDLFALLDKAALPELIDTTTQNDEIDALIDSGEWSEAERPLLAWLYEFAVAAGKSFSALHYVVGPDMQGLALADMLDIANLGYLSSVVELAEELGTSAAQINAWAALDLSQTDAANAKQAARGRYQLEQWYDLAPPLRDPLREKQRDALTAYMLHSEGFANTTELYNHFLFDAEMSACMLTSRIKLALSSVQLFLQRCLLNLEREFVEVAQSAEWEWRKNYRVWEANRKVFLYPESFIEPELRISRTEIFDAAQSILLQNSVTEEVAEQSFSHYLEVFDDVSNVEVIGSYHEQTDAVNDTAGIDRLHVVARTRGIPHKYYYRLRDGKTWSPWQEIDADIDADQVMPVVHDSRLYLLWPVFFQKQVAGNQVLDDVAINELVSSEAYEGNLAYQEYLNYILHWDWTDENGSIFDWGYSSLQAYVDTMGGVYDLDDVIGWVVATGADTWLEYAQELKDKFNETINYYEIKLSISEYKNGNWMPSIISDGYLESDKSRYAISLLTDSLPAPAPADFFFLTQIDDDVVVIECVQTLRYTDGDTYHFDEGHFKYDVLSKSILASEAQYDVSIWDIFEGILGAAGNRGITTPTGTMLSGNAFVEDEEPILEIPEISENTATNFVTLLEKTPGVYQVPAQHQYEEFAADDIFFFGDEKHSYTVSRSAAGTLYDSEIPLVEYNSSVGLYDYLGSGTPGLGVYTEFMGLNGSAVNLDSAGINRLKSNLRPGSQYSASADALQLEPNFDAKALTLSTLSLNQYDSVIDHVYKFESFYHPLSGELIRKVNGEGIAEAVSRDTQCIVEDYFESYYAPTEQTKKIYPQRHFCFSDIDAYGSYNYELFFHLPLMIATRLSKNQQFAEAQHWFHYIFNPTSRDGGDGAQRFWQFKPFFDMYDNDTGHPFESIYTMLYALSIDPALADADALALKAQTEEQIAVWKTEPFDPHAIAALRPVAYMKATVMKYLDNLIDWGDYLYQQFTHESINEATQLYLLAYQILGEHPLELPELETVASSYNELGVLDAFSNAVAELENDINLPINSGSTIVTIPPLYFCIPDNPNLLQYWDTVADRLFKIRHCMTIEGVVQQLPLFQPPIDPALLVRARASGVSISSALASLATPAPYYRFVYLMQKAVEYCNVVKGLGSQLLAAYEKQDAEELGIMRATHEDSLLKASTELRNLQVDEARENISALEKSKVLVEERINYYSNIEKRSEKEISSIRSLDDSERQRKIAGRFSVAASIAGAVPNFIFTKSVETGVPPKLHIGLDNQFGGTNIASILNSVSSAHANAAARHSAESNKTSTDASYDRRWDDWKLQERLAEKELKQVEKQIVAAEVRLALAEKERDNHAIQLTQSREVRDFLSDKFTSKELYGWMISQISAIYFQSYQLAYDLATRCEKAYQRETGEYDKSFIAYGHFDSMKKGLLSGDRLHHELQRMEFDYLNTNRREYELSKNISLSQLDPSALIALRETGECFISLPEMLFDFDYPGHYFRRIKSVSLTIPSITGPNTNLSSTLTLQSDKLRLAAKMDEREADDNNLRFNLAVVSSIATSSAQNDAGMFQMDYRDERYLPFEGAGVISEWKLALSDPQLSQFDYSSISDVVMHIDYTARDGGEVFRSTIEANLLSMIDDFFGTDNDLQQLISIKQTMADEWARLSNTTGVDNYLLSVNLGLNNFPYYLRVRGISITKLTIALSGEVTVSGWDNVEMPDEIDPADDTQTYKVAFLEAKDSTLGLASANFVLELPVEAEQQSIEISLPNQLVNEVGSSVTDIFIISDYDISAANPNS